MSSAVAECPVRIGSSTSFQRKPLSSAYPSIPDILLRPTARRPNRLTHDDGLRQTAGAAAVRLLIDGWREELVAETEHRKNERITAQWTRRLGWFTVVFDGYKRSCGGSREDSDVGLALALMPPVNSWRGGQRMLSGYRGSHFPAR